LNSLSEKYVYLEIENKIISPARQADDIARDLSIQAFENEMAVAAAYGIVKKHGGYINLTGGNPFNSRTMIYLPAA
jgi:hypothetical protein